ncbi:MAG TPA: DUF3857 domain-containing protein [Candidatus Binatia bacterium]|nr:DUF3857 domain-containing protein [Candidatus Binatia bacterium]
MPVRRLTPLAVTAASFLWLALLSPARAGDDWLPISPEELRMTSEPLAPGAPAIYLFRQVDRDDVEMHENVYIRIKVFTEEGRKQGDIEIPFVKGEGNVHGIRARTVRPDGTIAGYDGKAYEKTVVKARGLKYLAKTFTLPDVQPGSIIEYRYTYNWDSSLLYDSHWILNEDLFTKHAKFSLKLNTGSGYTVRWIGNRLPPGVALPNESPRGSVHMEVDNLPAFQAEDYMPPENELKSRVDFIYSSISEKDPQKFWMEMAKRLDAYVERFAGKSKEVTQAAEQTVAPGDAPEVKLQKLYARVQSLRNLSYETEKTEAEQSREKLKDASNAAEVLKNGYAYGTSLTWLFLAMARAAGLEAYPVFIARRDRYFFKPNSMNIYALNDTVVQVKLPNQDWYGDPGTLFSPFGMLWWPESGVHGLRLEKNGGTWVSTPLPSSGASRVERKASFRLDEHGSLDGKVTLTLTGLEAMGMRLEGRNQDAPARKRLLEDRVRESIPAGINAELINQPDWTSSSVPLKAEFEVKIPGWVAGAGRKGLFPVGVFSGGEKHLFEHASRVYPVYYPYPFQTEDEVNVQLPAGWKVESLPPAQSDDRKLCDYQSAAEERNGALHLTRRLSVNGLGTAAEAYPKLRAFYQSVRTSDELQIVLQPAAPSARP